jgi:hypothetical protein
MSNRVLNCHIPKSPHRDSNGRFTSINGHNVGAFYLRCQPLTLLAVMRGRRLRRAAPPRGGR